MLSSHLNRNQDGDPQRDQAREHPRNTESDEETGHRTRRHELHGMVARHPLDVERSPETAIDLIDVPCHPIARPLDRELYMFPDMS